MTKGWNREWIFLQTPEKRALLVCEVSASSGMTLRPHGHELVFRNRGSR